MKIKMFFPKKIISIIKAESMRKIYEKYQETDTCVQLHRDGGWGLFIEHKG
jgi:hypothetical protein